MKMDSVYKTVFIISIIVTCTIFYSIVLIGSINQFPTFIWAMSVWYMYKHDYKALILINKTMIAIAILCFLAIAISYDEQYLSLIGLSNFEILFSAIISLSAHYFLLNFFNKRFDENILDSSGDISKREDDISDKRGLVNWKYVFIFGLTLFVFILSKDLLFNDDKSPNPSLFNNHASLQYESYQPNSLQKKAPAYIPDQKLEPVQVKKSKYLGHEWSKKGLFTETGKSTFTWPDGSTYEGEWVNNQITGKGKRTWASGDTYEGEWVNGQRTGKGKYTWPDGSTYEGEFVNNQVTGKGKRTWASGDLHLGEWKNGKQEGRGIQWIGQTITRGIWFSGKFYKSADVELGEFDTELGDFDVGDFNHASKEEFLNDDYLFKTINPMNWGDASRLAADLTDLGKVELQLATVTPTNLIPRPEKLSEELENIDSKLTWFNHRDKVFMIIKNDTLNSIKSFIFEFHSGDCGSKVEKFHFEARDFEIPSKGYKFIYFSDKHIPPSKEDSCLTIIDLDSIRL